MRKSKAILFFLLASNYADAQQRPSEGAWLTLNMPVNFSRYWQWHNDAGYRTLGTSVEAWQYAYRTGIRCNFNKQWSIATGIAFFFTRTSFSKSNDEFGREFRIWEELNHLRSITPKLQWLMRFRTEQRFFAATSDREKYTGYRFRLRTGFIQKLNTKWGLQLADEYFRQQANQKFSFDQNRLLLSGIYYMNHSAQLQAGYMWQHWPDDNQHILTLNFTKNISSHGD